jgi:hypothetical protein
MRLVIHAGFGKCGSSAIQVALQNRHKELRRQSVFLFGKDLSIYKGQWLSGMPFWKVAETLRKAGNDQTLAPRIVSEMQRSAATAPDATFILSSEGLGNPGKANLLRTIDEAIDTTVVFYLRPQFEWIPSAWKQWSLRKGTPLPRHIDRCLAAHKPAFRAVLDDWSRLLPRAKLQVRILAQAVTENGSPARDFFKILGADYVPGKADDARVNPSLDFAILHLLSRNPWLFENRRETEVFNALTSMLPQRYLSTNISMLSPRQKERIADHFRDDNMYILRTHCGMSESGAQQAYDSYFRPEGTGRAYGDVDDVEIVYRCLSIMLDAMMQRDGRKPIFRPPYWKAPQRAAKHFGEWLRKPR